MNPKDSIHRIKKRISPMMMRIFKEPGFRIVSQRLIKRRAFRPFPLLYPVMTSQAPQNRKITARRFG
jgi:hypothetical protein